VGYPPKENDVTYNEAVEISARAIARLSGYNEDNWANIGDISTRAKETVTILAALKLIKPEGKEGDLRDDPPPLSR